MFLNSLKSSGKYSDNGTMTNVVASDNGGYIANSPFHNEADHIFLETVLKLFNSTFIKGEYTSSGGRVFTKAIQMLCAESIGIIRDYSLKNLETKNCSGMTIAESSSFFPNAWFKFC